MVGVGSRDHAEQVEVLEGGEDEKNELQTGEEARSLETGDLPGVGDCVEEVDDDTVVASPVHAHATAAKIQFDFPAVSEHEWR